LVLGIGAQGPMTSAEKA